MQSVSAAFTTSTTAPVRKLTSKVFISFRKDYDAGIDFFEIGTSLIGGTDILKGTNNVVQEWDKFNYEDFSDRIISISYNREVDAPVSSITIAQAEFVLDNHDDLFVPANPFSSLSPFVLPRRPVKIAIGFGTEPLQIFVGLTVGLPEIDEKNKTARFKASDFMESFINRSLDEAVIYESMVTTDVIASLLEDHAGLLSTQYDLDAGTQTIPFAYFPKGSKIKDALNELVEAELGNMFCSEQGVITFQNRQNWLSNTLVWNFTKGTTLEFTTPGLERIINVAEVESNVRAVQANQKIWEQESAFEILPGVTVDIFANFSDDDGDLPVTAVDDPVYITSATTSLYATNENADGSGATRDAFITLDSTSTFSTGFKMTFTNSYTASVFLTLLELWGTPAKVVKHIYVREQDDASVGINDGFDERPIKIENDFIQEESTATTIAKLIIADRAEFNDQREIIVLGVPQLQIGDVVNYEDEIINEDYYVSRVNGNLNATGGFQQLLELTQRKISTYFIIGVSDIGGDDLLGP